MVYDNLKNRLDQLIETGDKVLSTKHPPPRGRGVVVIAGDYVDNDPFYQCKAGSLSFLKAAFGENSTDFR